VHIYVYTVRLRSLWKLSQNTKFFINSWGPFRTEFEVINKLFIMNLRVIFKMSSKRASVNPLAGFLKPQSPAERLAAQHRDREKLQRERQLKELQEEEAKARLSLLLSTVQHQPQPQPHLHPLQQAAVAVHRQHSQEGSQTQKSIPDKALPKCPRTQKTIPRPPHELKS